MKKLFLLAAVAVGFLAASPADAADKKAKKKPAAAPSGSVEERFKKLDTNNDGKLSLDEFKAGLPAPAKAKKEAAKKKKPGDDAEKLFNMLDANNDKFLSPDEFKNHTPAAAEPKKKKKDK